jgi:hypothetical protein
MGYDTTKSSKAEKEFTLLDTDIYRMVIKKAEIAPNQYAEPDENGVYPDQLLIVWEVFEAGPEQEDGVVGNAVFQRMAPWYGAGKRGPSQFKVLADALIAQGHAIDLSDFDPDALVGIKQRVSVELYTKTMGKNAGQPGNRIVGAPKPLKKQPAAPSVPAVKAQAAAPTKPAAKPAPKPRVESDEVFEDAEAVDTY